MNGWALLAGASVLSAAGTALAWRYALRHGVLDVPGARSSHDVPTPRGGGISIVAAATGVLLLLVFSGRLSPWLGTAWLASLAVALVGWMDDHRGSSPWLRLAVHLGAAAWVVGHVPIPTQSGLTLGLGILAVAWVVNLYNFMDGIDGLAAGEAVFLCLGAGVLMAEPAAALEALAWGVAGASAGFLVLNWPPARIFMGDVGSGFLGITVALLALAAWATGALSLGVWLVLGAVFWVDATYTLLVRALTRQPVWEAHRSHAYQILARRWGSHGRVTRVALAYNVFWLFPLAAWCGGAPHKLLVALLLAVVPVLGLCVAVRAGLPEPKGSAPRRVEEPQPPGTR